MLMSALLFFLPICYIVEKTVLSIALLFITGIASISMISDDINDGIKLIKRESESILLCNLSYED